MPVFRPRPSGTPDGSRGLQPTGRRRERARRGADALIRPSGALQVSLRDTAHLP